MAQFSRKTQAALYYARKRRRSLAASVRLHRTVNVPVDSSLPTPFTDSQLNRGVTFKTKIDLSGPTGTLFSLGSSVVVNRTTTSVIVTWRGNVIADVAQPMVDAEWDLVIALVPGIAQSRVWNQYGELARNQLTGPPFTTLADPGDVLQASSLLLEGVSVYACQVPRHFHPVPQIEVVQIVDNLLFNLTAAHFLPGFQSPKFEP